jgi:alcohol dehydrogenase class IV
MALTAPVALAQASALNAFSMAVEGLQSDIEDPLAEALLTHALRMLAEWLPRLRSAPDDPEPRMRLMLAALLCGQGSDYVGGGLAQALSHAAGPRSSTSNGIVEALLLPYTMRYNAPVAGARLARTRASRRGSRRSQEAPRRSLVRSRPSRRLRRRIATGVVLPAVAGANGGAARGRPAGVPFAMRRT